MKRALKQLGYLGIAMIVAIAMLIGTAWIRSDAALAQVHTATPVVLPLRDDLAQIERGQHLAMTRGCTDCHGDDLAGKKLIDEQPMGRLYGANLTLFGGRDPAELEHAIRQGLRNDGRSLVFMPTLDYAGLSDADTAALIVYLQSLAPKGEPMPASAPGVVPRVLWMLGKFPLISHEEVRGKSIARAELQPAVTAEYGAYVAQVCQGCHNPRFSGGPMAGAPPEAPPPANLTPHSTGLAGWSEADFLTVMRTGVRPDGRSLHPFMPWQTFSRMSDEELRATWLFLSHLPPRAKGDRS